MALSTFLRMLTGPSVYWVHRSPAGDKAAEHVRGLAQLGHAYEANWMETWGQRILGSMRVWAELIVYTSPLFFPYLVRRVEAYVEHPRSLADLCLGLSCLVMVGLVLRTCGRTANPAYVEFAKVWGQAQTRRMDTGSKTALRHFDFDFWAWPKEFVAASSSSGQAKKFLAPRDYTALEQVRYLPHRLFGWLMINTFGLKLIYPGSTKWLFQLVIGSTLTEQRATLVSKNQGERFRLETEDGNRIDSMFFDKRSQGGNGSALVICCEGNAGFYEMGLSTTALKAGYSVVGWNHPGFWGSSGSPLPSQDAHAVDAVLQFARDKLNFAEEDILVYGWSIGGFTATWLGMNYPHLRGLILDATFDDITPLAVDKMPASLESVVKMAIDDNVKLNVAEQLVKFPGPVRLIRRTQDEMISTDDSQKVQTNRGNDLLQKLLQHRYPNLFADNDEALTLLSVYLMQDTAAGRENVFNTRHVNVTEIEASMNSYVRENGLHYPMEVGSDFSDEQKTNWLLFLASRYMTEFDSAHCPPLSVDLFQEPWSPLPKRKEGKEEKAD